MNLKYVIAIVSASLGALGGFAIGRGTASHSLGNHADSISGNPAAAGGGAFSSEIAPASSQTLNPSQGTAVKPITAAELQGELAALETSGFLGNGADSMRKMADLQDRLRVSDVASIAAEMCSVPLSQGRMQGFYLVMSAYAEKDPQGAWALALGTKNRMVRENALMGVVSAVGAKDPARAVAMADSIEDAQLKRQIRSMAVANIAQKDPQRALGLLLEKGKPEEGDYSVSMIFSQWAQKDPEAAKAALGRLSGRDAVQARMALVSSLTQKDPQAAWNYALTLPSSGERGGYGDPRVQVVQQWAQSDPQAALKAALSIPDPGTKGMAISSVIGSWSRSDFGGALKYAVSVEDSTMRADILRTLSNSSSGNHKELLDAVLDHMPPGDNFQQAVSGIFSNWARENPAEAAASIAQLPPGRVFSNAASQIASQWVRSASNKQEVFDWVKTLPGGEARSDSLGAVFREWSNADPQEALKALGSLPPDDRASAFSSLAAGWSRKSPEAALQWAGSMTDAKDRGMVVRTAVSQWANTQPASAAKYVERLPEAERSGPMQVVVDNWASKDTGAAASWLERQPAGVFKDAALGSLARKISQEDPEAALTWVAGITDEKQRLRQTESVARDWMRQNPAAARQWISSSNLPGDVRKRLLD